MPGAAEIVAGIDKLATLPAVYLKVKHIIDDPDGSINDLAQALKFDAAMTARVLRIVNSPFFGMLRRIDTITRALNVLGMQRVHDVVLTWAISAAFAGVRPQILSMNEFWSQSAFRAIAARTLGEQAGFLDAERLFVEGLLSDIGHLIMYCRVPELADRASREHARSGWPLHELEREIVGCDYAEVGATLVRSWNLPESFYEPIACQIVPASAREHALEAAILHIAAALVQSNPEDELTWPGCGVDSAALATLSLEMDCITEVRRLATLEVSKVIAALFPQLASAA